jgi:hypothetical protein
MEGDTMITDFPPDVSGLPPARRYAAQAERLADPVMARTYGDLAKSMTASHAQLLGFVRAGTGYQLADDTIVAGTNAAQVNAAVLSAKAAAGKGGPCDNAGFRRWLTGRCKDLGLPAPDFTGPDSTGNGSSNTTGSLTNDPGGARPPGARINRYDGRSGDAGKSAGPGEGFVLKMLSNGRVEIETGSVTREALAKSPALGQLEPTVAGEAYVKSQRYTGLAMKAIDPQTREMYLTAAREVRKAAGL